MGREIRRVPPTWVHPEEDIYDPIQRETVRRFKPLYNQDAETAWAEWLKGFKSWCETEHASKLEKYPGEMPPLTEPYRAYCEWNGRPPDPKSCRPVWKDEDATHFQMYETVSEGTPVSPVFATKEELVDYLVANGDFWDQKRRERGWPGIPCGPWSRERAERFVNDEWQPTMIVVMKPDDEKAKGPVE